MWGVDIEFQSPRNRVKCSDAIEVTGSMVDPDGMFQSPRNRVKCSDACRKSTHRIRRISFNPLEIGSSVLMRNTRPRKSILSGVSIP